MTLGVTKSELLRAAMEGICFEMRGMLDALKDAGFHEFKKLRVTGGAARSDLWNQIQADIYGCPVETVNASEATALGAAMIGAVGAGVFKDLPKRPGIWYVSRILMSRSQKTLSDTTRSTRYSRPATRAWQRTDLNRSMLTRTSSVKRHSTKRRYVMEFSFLTARKIVFKTGAVADIAQYIAGYGKNFLIVVDPFFKESETMQKVKSSWTLSARSIRSTGK